MKQRFLWWHDEWSAGRWGFYQVQWLCGQDKWTLDLTSPFFKTSYNLLIFRLKRYFPQLFSFISLFDFQYFRSYFGLKKLICDSRLKSFSPFPSNFNIPWECYLVFDLAPCWFVWISKYNWRSTSCFAFSLFFFWEIINCNYSLQSGVY